MLFILDNDMKISRIKDSFSISFGKSEDSPIVVPANRINGFIFEDFRGINAEEFHFIMDFGIPIFEIRNKNTWRTNKFKIQMKIPRIPESHIDKRRDYLSKQFSFAAVQNNIAMLTRIMKYIPNEINLETRLNSIKTILDEQDPDRSGNSIQGKTIEKIGKIVNNIYNMSVNQLLHTEKEKIVTDICIPRRIQFSLMKNYARSILKTQISNGISFAERDKPRSDEVYDDSWRKYIISGLIQEFLAYTIEETILKYMVSDHQNENNFLKLTKEELDWQQQVFVIQMIFTRLNQNIRNFKLTNLILEQVKAIINFINHDRTSYYPFLINVDDPW